jgi:hypothetical protein
MIDRGMIILSSCAGALVLSIVTGAIFAATWGQMLLIFLIFAIALFFTIKSANSYKGE